MKKAYCGLPDFNIEAKQIIENAGIDLTVDTGNRPAGDKLIDILQKYDILIIGVFSKLTADMIKYVKTPKIIASFSVGLDHIDKWQLLSYFFHSHWHHIYQKILERIF